MLGNKYPPPPPPSQILVACNCFNILLSCLCHMSTVSWWRALSVFLHSGTQADGAGRGQGEFWRGLHRQWNVLAQERHASLLLSHWPDYTQPSARGVRKYHESGPGVCLKAREAGTSGEWAVMVSAIFQERRRGGQMMSLGITWHWGWGGEKEPAKRPRRSTRMTRIPGRQVMLLPLRCRVFHSVKWPVEVSKVNKPHSTRQRRRGPGNSLKNKV